MSPQLPALATVVWIGATLLAYFGWRRLYLRWRHPLLHPVPWATALIAAAVFVLRHPLEAFRAETAPVVWPLGPAVVAMAYPVWERRSMIAENWRGLALVITGSLALSAGSMVLATVVLGREVALALTVKSVTAPVALGIATNAGLRPDLVMVGVMMSGLYGVVAGPATLARFGVGGDTPALGAALGCASHGVGTARALEIGGQAGAFASVCMGLSALAYGLVLPMILQLV